jgi:mannan endo-1,4-beta-mannosidase
MHPFRFFVPAILLLTLAAPGKTFGLGGKKPPAAGPVHPVNPNASREARMLLKYLYSIEGKYTLSGMHNVLGKMSEYYDSVYLITGKHPAIWGGDFGFADSTHDIDNIKYRPLLVPEIEKQYHAGAIIVMTYHQANPIIGEPCNFIGGVQSKLTDQQWKDLLTPGTIIYEAWRRQMDKLATVFLELRNNHIPIIFRPYHEANGSWFWWGGRPGDGGSSALYRQLFDYFTKKWKLTNILWAWTPDKPWPGISDFYPGSQYVDILGSDIYPMRDTNVIYRQQWYDTMKAIAAGKPLALTENSAVLADSILQHQPWLWFMSWGNLLFYSNNMQAIRDLYANKKVLSREDLPDWKRQHE